MWSAIVRTPIRHFLAWLCVIWTSLCENPPADDFSRWVREKINQHKKDKALYFTYLPRRSLTVDWRKFWVGRNQLCNFIVWILWGVEIWPFPLHCYIVVNTVWTTVHTVIIISPLSPFTQETYFWWSHFRKTHIYMYTSNHRRKERQSGKKWFENINENCLRNGNLPVYEAPLSLTLASGIYLVITSQARAQALTNIFHQQDVIPQNRSFCISFLIVSAAK